MFYQYKLDILYKITYISFFNNISCYEFLHNFVASTVNALRPRVGEGPGNRVLPHISPPSV